MRRCAGAQFLLVMLVLTTASGRAEEGDEKTAAAVEPLLSPLDAGAPDMTNLLDDAVKKLAATRNQEAIDKLAQKDYPGALDLLKQAYDLDSGNAEIANNLGYIYYLLGNTEEADTFLRRALQLDSTRYIAYVNLADLLGREGEPEKRLAEAAQLLKRARELHGNKSGVILRQARVARLREKLSEAKRYYREYVKSRKPTDKVLIEIGDFFREMGQTDDAFKWYQQVDDQGEWGKEAAGRIWEIEVARQAKQYGWLRRQDIIPESARELVTNGKRSAARGDTKNAKRLFEEALDIAPAFSDAYAELGDLHKKERNFAAAEVSYLRAMAIDNGNAELYLRLGELYLALEPKKDYARATLFLARALEIRPDWAAVHLPLALALRGTGDLEGALKNLDFFLEQTPKGEKHREAIRLKRTIQNLISKNVEPPMPGKPGNAGEGHAITEDLVNALTRARTHLAKGRPDAAMAELRRLPKEQKGTLVLNLEARILHASGHLKDAARRLNASLKLDNAQSAVHEQLGNILYDTGRIEAARRHFARAAALGNGAAHYHLARLDVEPKGTLRFQWMNDLLAVKSLIASRTRLVQFLSNHSGSVYEDDAKALKADIERRLWTLFVVVTTSFATLVIIAVVFIRRRLGGVGLMTLITRHPDAGPEVQRVLSAIRHEVLKHNTLALGGVIDSIERNRPDAAEKAFHFQRNLLGGEGHEAVPLRLEHYANELTKVGRSYGVRLNLTRREPAIALLFRGFGMLEALSRQLNHVDELGKSGRGRLLKRLKKAYHLLNVEGYEAVQQMLGKIRVLQVDESLVRRIYVQVLREPAFSDLDVAPLDIETAVSLPCEVLLSQRAFEDIFANLFRNAVQSSVAVDLTPVELGFGIDVEIDEVTGIERMVFLVKDRSREALTTDMIRGQAIEGGLGITADLVTRYDGTVDVVPGDRGWEKAVRVKFPMASAT